MFLWDQDINPRVTPKVKQYSVKSLMIFSQALFDDGVYQLSYFKPHQLEESSHKWSVETMMNEARNLETSKIIKERKCECSFDLCLDDQCIVKV